MVIETGHRCSECCVQSDKLSWAAMPFLFCLDFPHCCTSVCAQEGSWPWAARSQCHRPWIETVWHWPFNLVARPMGCELSCRADAVLVLELLGGLWRALSPGLAYPALFCSLPGISGPLNMGVDAFLGNVILLVPLLLCCLWEHFRTRVNPLEHSCSGVGCAFKFAIFCQLVIFLVPSGLSLSQLFRDTIFQ